jgi:hypothetical protein
MAAGIAEYPWSYTQVAQLLDWTSRLTEETPKRPILTHPGLWKSVALKVN